MRTYRLADMHRPRRATSYLFGHTDRSATAKFARLRHTRWIM
jgi:hypothetical protein